MVYLSPNDLVTAAREAVDRGFLTEAEARSWILNTFQEIDPDGGTLARLTRSVVSAANKWTQQECPCQK